jgi:DNA-binding CsgD family transcriptional regulator
MMWVGTARGGINASPAGRVKFAHYKRSRFDPASLSRTEVRALGEAAAGRIWVGFDEGLDEFDARAGVVRRFVHDPLDPGSLSAGAVRAFCRDGAGRVWVGLDEHGLDRLDPRTGRFAHHRNDPDDSSTISNNRVYAIRPDGSDPFVLWIGTHQGLNRFDTRTGRFTRYLHDEARAASLSSSIVTAVLPARSGALWVGTSWGLNRLDPATGRSERFIGDIRDPSRSGPADNIIHCLHEDAEGALWMGTNNGLSRFDVSGGTWSHILPKDGLPGGVVCGILEDEGGRLWLSTNRGLARYDPEARSFIRFGRQDGTQADEFFPGVCLKDAKGNMAFGGVNGFNLFRPSDVRGNPFAPPVAWTAFTKNGRESGLELAPLRANSLKLKSGTEVYEFEFAALCFGNPALNRYAYKLEPRDRDWIDLGTARTVALSDLRPGGYRLSVKGASPDGVWSRDELAILLKVVAPFWRTRWFLALALAFAAAGVGLVVRMWMKLKSAVMVVGDRADGIVDGYDLTPREKEILRLILQGGRNKDIAAKLFVSGSTVRNHIYNIYQKLGVASRIELINRIGKDARDKP